MLLATASSIRFSDTLLAVDPEYLKHDNILPVLLYNIRAALNLTVYIWESKRPEQNVYHGGRVAQWLGRRISDQGVPGSNPGRCTFRCDLELVTFTLLSTG